MAQEVDWTSLMRKIKSGSINEIEASLQCLRLSVIEMLERPRSEVFLIEFMPWSLSLLSHTPPSCDPKSPNHRIRYAVLGCLAKTTALDEALRPHLETLSETLIKVLMTDNEECALLALHAIIDLQKSFRQAVEGIVPPFLEFVMQLLESMDVIVKEHKNAAMPFLMSSRHSLKIVLECPVVVVLIFQLHRRFINDYINRFVPLIMKALSVEAAISSAPWFNDFMSAKVKILSFLAYVSRGFIAAVRSFHTDIPPIVLSLLKDCPVDLPSSRKELLVAIRHLLSTDLRTAFIPFINSLLDERLLLGDGWSAQTFLRPLAYSLLADLVHHVRLDLSQKNLFAVINLFCRLLIDPSLPVGIQTMSAKLLLNLIDPVMSDRTEKLVRKLFLQKILSALLFKVTSLSRLLCCELADQVLSNDRFACPYYQYNHSDRDLLSVLSSADSLAMESWKDGAKELKALLKTLFNSLKAVILSVKGPQQQDDSSTLASISAIEVQSFVAFFVDGISCMRLLASYSSALLDPKASRAFSVSSIPADEKELLDQFAYIFTLLELPHFFDVMERSLPVLVAAIQHNFALLAIPQYFLAISGLSRHFSSILSRFLVDRLHVLGEGGSVEADLDAAIHLRLFKLLFLSVSVYPEENEAVLQPHVSEIIMHCLRNHSRLQTSSVAKSDAIKGQQTINYFYLLRSLFRSIGGGRFESLYKEVLPLLPVILEELNRLIFDRDSMDVNTGHREIYVELCLTVPVRLSVLLPYLPLLMKPLVISLSSSNELIGQGLRTLELCVDNLTQDFLEPVLTPIFDELQKSLWSLLQPSLTMSNAHAQVAMRVLGKLGGRSRRLGKLLAAPGFEPHLLASPGCLLAMSVNPRQRSQTISVPFDCVIETAASVVADPLSQQNQAFFNDAFNIVKHYLFSSMTLVAPIDSASSPTSYTDLSMVGEDFGRPSRELIRKCLLCLLKGLDLQDSLAVRALIESVYKHALDIISKLDSVRSGMVIIDDIKMLVDVLIQGGSDSNAGGHQMVVTFVEGGILEGLRGQQFTTLSQIFFDRLMSFCYESGKSARPGLSALISRVSEWAASSSSSEHDIPVWIGPISTRFLRSLLYLLKDTTVGSMVPRSGTMEHLVVERVSQSVYRLLKACMRITSPSLQPQSMQPEHSVERLQANVTQTVTVLVAELSCPNATVREVVQDSFQLIADSRGIDVTELLTPFRDRLLPPIFTKPLRALPFSMQIGHIDAVTFCLGLRPPLVGWSEELLRMLQEVLALAESEDHNLLGGGNKAGQLKNTAVLIGLRVVCIRFLSTCLPLPDLQSPKQGVIRNHIVSVFFKALYSRSPEVVEVAKKGLELVVANQSKLPKDLLQLGLRPVLMNLAEAKRLTLAGLEGLCRVLQLLTSYFKAEIGRKLLDHLSQWAEPKLLEESRSRHLLDVPEIKIIAAILQVFPLLPTSANIFLSELVQLVADLESRLIRRASSPFRSPLFAFLCKYPEDAAACLIENVTVPSVITIYSGLLFSHQTQSTAALAKEIVGKAAARMVSSIVQPSNSPSLRIEYLRLLVGIGGQSGRLLAGSRLFRDLVGTLWSNIDILIRKDAAMIISEEEVDLLMTLSKIYISSNPSDIEFVFAWLALLRPPLPMDLSLLPKYVIEQWLPLCPSSDLAKALKLWLSFTSNPDVHGFSKSLVTRLVAIPIAKMQTFSMSSDTLLLASIRNQLWSKGPVADSSMAVNELEFTAALMSAVGNDSRHRKEVEDFCAARSHSADPTLRIMSLALLNHLAKSQDTYWQLLKMSTLETKSLIKTVISSSPPDLRVLKDFLNSSEHVTIASVLVIWLVMLDGDMESDDELAISLLMSINRFGTSMMSVVEHRYIPARMAELAMRCLQNCSKNILQLIQNTIHVLFKCFPSFLDKSAESAAAQAALLSFVRMAKDRFSLRALESVDISSLERFVVQQPSIQPTASGSFSQTTPSQSSSIVDDEACHKAVIATVGLLEIAMEDEALLLKVLSTAPKLIDAIMTMNFLASQGIVERLVSIIHRSQYFKVRLDNLLTECLQSGRIIYSLPLLVKQELGSSSSESMVNSVYRFLQKLAKDMTNDQQQCIVFIELAKLLLQRQDSHLKAGIHSSLMMVWTRPGLIDCHREIIKMLQSSLITSGSGASRLLPVKECVEMLQKGLEVILPNPDLARDYFGLLLDVYALNAQSNADSANLKSTDAYSALQPSFLCGLLERDAAIRQPITRLLYMSSLSPSLSNLLMQVLVGLDWPAVGARFWLRSVLSIVFEHFIDHGDGDATCLKIVSRSLFEPNNPGLGGEQVDQVDPNVFIQSVATLLHHNDHLARRLFVSMFPALWHHLVAPQQSELDSELVSVLSKPELLCQRFMRPNVPEAILEAIYHCKNIYGVTVKLSPQLIRYIAQNFCGWHAGALCLEDGLASDDFESHNIDRSQNALAGLLERLGDDDMWYGVMRRRAVFPETIVSLSLAQAGQWPAAQASTEATLQKARNGAIGYHSGEYSQWERLWYQSAKALQQWDLLGEVAKIDGDVEIQLESLWHSADWSSPDTQSIALSLVKNPKSDIKRKISEGLVILEQLRDCPDMISRFHAVLEESCVIVLREWWSLPSFRPAECHMAALESFQSIVELQESQLIFANLSIQGTAPSSLSASTSSYHYPFAARQQPFLQELKGLLGTWRDRLPNQSDRLSAWSDMLAWRQHVYSALSAAFQMLLPVSEQPVQQQPSLQQSQQQAPQQSSTHPLAFRGCHETAWLINKFARVTRKNCLLDVCLSTLNRIYTLPNIEIQDAFLKLREQTKCYMTEAVDLPLALEVVNATNLNYFNSAQKAEFFTLKAIIYMRLGMLDEANRILAQAVQIDLNIPKGWSVWAGYNDLRFQQSNDRTYAVNAINCYLQAASLNKSAKCRKFLARVLWLSTFEDDAGTVLKPFELYASELPVWYWIFFIPQLILALNRKEYRQARYLLIKIAKTFPQALYASLRAANEDFRLSGALSSMANSTSVKSQLSPEVVKFEEDSTASVKRPAAEEAEEIMAILKTAYPLLTLSIENLVDHLVNRLRATPDEDLFRILTTLYTEANQQLALSIGTNGSDDVGTPFRVAIDQSLKRVSEMIGSFNYLQQKYKTDFDSEFITSSPSLVSIVRSLRMWRSRLEETVSALPSTISIDTLSRYLSEFEHQKYDDVELAEGHDDFVRIAKLYPVVKIVKRHGTSYRKIIFIGHDGSTHGFLVQNPVARNGRREERLMQFFRLLNGPMSRKIWTKRRNLEFSIPTIIPISSHARLVKDDQDSMSLEEIIHLHLQKTETIDPVQFYLDTLVNFGRSSDSNVFKRGSSEFMNLRLDINTKIINDVIPDDLLLKFVASTFPCSADYWTFRRLFTQQYALTTFMCYMMAFGHRTPAKYILSLCNGQILINEILPSINNSGQIAILDAVPFRLTPNIQKFIGAAGIEGPFAECIRSTASIFSQVEKGDLGLSLPLFLRDELAAWFVSTGDSSSVQSSSLEREATLFSSISSYEHEFCSARIKPNIELLNKRVLTLACVRESEIAHSNPQNDGVLPANQAILDLVSCATNPQKLALMDPIWHPWF